MEERYHATTQNRFYPDMSNLNTNISVETKLISSPTYFASAMCFSTDSLVTAYSHIIYLSHSLAVIPYTVDSNSDNREFIVIITQWWFYIFFTYTQRWNCQFETPQSTNYCHIQWGFRGYKNLKPSECDKLGARAHAHTHITLRCLQGSTVIPLEFPCRNGT